MVKSESAKTKKVNEGKMFALMSYLSILCIIPLVFKKDNEFVLSHGKQGLVLFVGEVGVFILSIIFPPWIIKIAMFVLFVLSFVGIIAVLRGKYIQLPVVAIISDEITL